ncbi:MAG: hypothetical protein ABW072_09235 [Sedimenticola sp.]
MRRIPALILLSILLTACVPQWKLIDESSNRIETEKFSFTAPPGWIQIQLDNQVVLTVDGPGLQKILVKYLEHEKAFPNLERKSNPEMLPSELADLYIAEMRESDANGLPSFKLSSNTPLVIDGNEGFQIHASYTIKNGLKYQHIVSGFTAETGITVIEYVAPGLHYFDRHQAAYVQLLGSFRQKS